MSNHNLARSTKSYREALLNTEHLDAPNLGFIKPSEYQGTPFVQTAIIKQNNIQIHLLVQIAETLKDIQGDLKLILKQTASSSSPVLPDDLVTKLTKLSLGPTEKPREGRGQLRVFRDPYKILQEEQAKLKK